MRWLNSITEPTDMNLSKLPQIVADRGAWRPAIRGIQRVRHDLATDQRQFTPEGTGRCIKFSLFWIVCFCKKSWTLKRMSELKMTWCSLGLTSPEYFLMEFLYSLRRSVALIYICRNNVTNDKNKIRSFYFIQDKSDSCKIVLKMTI